MPKLDIDALFELEEQITERLVQNVEQILIKLNQEEKLETFLDLIGMRDLLGDDSITWPNDGKIIIVGASEVSKDVLLGIAKQYGISKDRFEFHLEYEDAKTYNFEKARWSWNYCCIMVGPMPHSGVSKGEFSSIITRLEREDGFPPIVELSDQNGKLKITKTSFKEAIKHAVGEGLIA